MSEDQVTRVEPPKNRGGVWVVFGTEEYKVPALGFQAVIELQDKVKGLAEIGTAPTPEQADTVSEIVWRALRRNYPEIAKADVVDMLDLSNFQPVVSAVLNVSGFQRAKAGESPGEASASTGMESTPP